MSVEGYVGYWGSGKSLMLCREILLEQRRDPDLLVFNNFGFSQGNAYEVTTVDEIVAVACMPFDGRRKLIAIDEIGMLLRSRGSATWPPAADVVFQQGRKLGLDVRWTTQHWRFLDVNVRRVTEKVTECHGYLRKRISRRKERPVKKRPRLFRQRVFMAPNPESTELPKKPDHVKWTLWNQAVAESYDTMRLVEAAQEMLQRQQDDASRLDVVQLALADLAASRADVEWISSPAE